MGSLDPQYKKRGGGGGGGGDAVHFRSDTKSGGGVCAGVLSTSSPIQKVWRGGAACRTMDDTMIYIFVCVRVRDSAGQQLVSEGGTSYEWGAAAPTQAYAGSGAAYQYSQFN